MNKELVTFYTKAVKEATKEQVAIVPEFCIYSAISYNEVAELLSATIKDMADFSAYLLSKSHDETTWLGHNVGTCPFVIFSLINSSENVISLVKAVLERYPIISKYQESLPPQADFSTEVANPEDDAPSLPERANDGGDKESNPHEETTSASNAPDVKAEDNEPTIDPSEVTDSPDKSTESNEADKRAAILDPAARDGVEGDRQIGTASQTELYKRLYEAAKHITSTQEKEKTKSRTDHHDEVKKSLAKAKALKPPKHLEILNGADIIGRDKEIEEMVLILSRNQKANPILIGEPGVGKTALVKGLVNRIKKGNVPDSLVDTPIFSLNVGDLLAGTGLRGSFEEKTAEILTFLKNYKANSGLRPVLFIDEIHTIMGAGTASGQNLDFANTLKPALADGLFSLIGATTYAEYEQYIKVDGAMDRRFYPVTVNEPSVEDTIAILEGIKKPYEKHHKAHYTPEAIRACAILSKRYINDNQLPDKAIDLMDEAGSKAQIEGYDTVDDSLVIKVVSDHLGIPIGAIASTESDKLATLEEALKSRIFGQDEACKKVADYVKVQRAFGNPTSPASLFFVGPTGTGKSELAKVLAETMNMNLVKIDCSEYYDHTSVTKLIGVSHGFVDSEKGGVLTNEVRRHPYSVVLFDEIEKADRSIYNLFLQVMNDGELTDGLGRKVDFKNTIVIFTSNAGAADVEKRHIGFSAIGASEHLGNEAMTDAVKKTFSPEFIGRINAIVNFNNVSEVATLIARKELDSFAKELRDKNLQLTYSDDVVSAIVNKGITLSTGARLVKHIIMDTIQVLVANDIIKNGAPEGDLYLNAEDGEIKLNRLPAKKNN